MAGFDHNLQQGGFFFEGDQGEAVFVAGELLAAALRDSGSLRLVVLNACDTARVVGNTSFNPFRSISTALVHEGFPAVAGMQFPISDRAAISFSASFYARLAAGDSLEEALTEARQSIYMMDAHSLEWARPVLFTRLPAGCLFKDSKQRAHAVRLKIFLCHSSRDKPIVRELYRRLTSEGFDVWLDEVNILPGKLWREEIIKALRESHVILICLSQDARMKEAMSALLHP